MVFDPSEAREGYYPDEGKVTLTEIKNEAKKFVALLQEPETGLFTWHTLVRERLENLHRLTAQALGK